MSFKDRVNQDIKKVYLNFAFFAEEHMVEDRKILIVIDDDALREKQGGQDLAVAESATLFYAATEDLPKRRAPGELINIDGRECTIDDWSENAGMATVYLRENIIA